MDLRDISRSFDFDPLYDAYTGVYLYDGQFATYEGGQLDGSFIRRRTVSLAPEYVLPDRRVVMLYGEPWVLSDPIRDGFGGEVIRQTMSARKCHGKYAILSAAELVLGTLTPREAYAFSRWTKNTADAATSNLEPYYEFSFSATEASVTSKFIVLDGVLWHTRMSAQIAEGFLFSEADLLTEDLVTQGKVQVTKTSVDQITLQETVLSKFTGVLVQRYQFFKKLDQAQESNYAGDMTLIVAKVSDPEPEGSYTLAGKTWSILDLEDLGDGWAVHIRRIE